VYPKETQSRRGHYGIKYTPVVYVKVTEVASHQTLDGVVTANSQSNDAIASSSSLLLLSTENRKQTIISINLIQVNQSDNTEKSMY
jgi:hypothetical protein